MTYPASTISYWVGQANDQSSGRHPTGWVNGQRWSVTAGQWMSMFDGSQAALAAMTADRDTWTGRANQAWGTSRVWNNGSSFETDLAAMTADRNTWQGRANNAWGASRVWSSGESWEAAYGRVLPSASNQLTVGLPNQGLNSSFTVFGTLTLDKTGPWHIAWNNAMGDASSSNDWAYGELRNDSAGGAVLAANVMRFRWSGVGNNVGHQAVGVFNAGTVIRLYVRCTAGSGNWSIDGAGQMVATFGPTPTYPH